MEPMTDQIILYLGSDIASKIQDMHLMVVDSHEWDEDSECYRVVLRRATYYDL